MAIWPRRKRTRAVLIGLVLLGAVAIFILAQPRARASLRLVYGFTELETDSRVFYEAGAGDLAKAVADALPAAVARVEECQFEPMGSFRVYVCASHKSFTGHIGHPENSPVRGIAFLWDIWVSPKAFDFRGKDTHRETLKHELSHLHLGQQLGWWRRTNGVPSWFQEGLADWVADTGDEQVTRREARNAIANGLCIVPETSGQLPFPKRPKDYGLSWPMFHMQSRMFVEYLRSRNADAFEGFVAGLVRGSQFETAFRDCFHADLSDVWQEFLDSSQP